MAQIKCEYNFRLVQFIAELGWISGKTHSSVESDEYPEAGIINTLAEILGRPICVVEGITTTNFFNSNFPKWDFNSFKILRSDPIFIFYDTAGKKYHGLLARGELYFELQLKKKLTSKEHANTTGISLSPGPGTLQARLSKLREGMFHTGLVAAPGDTTFEQKASGNKSSPQKSPALKSGVF